MQSSEISLADVSSLIPLLSETTAGYITEGDSVLVMKSVEEFGILSPLVVTAQGRIVDGVTRWNVAKSLGLEKVPVVVVDVSDGKAAALHILLNRARSEQVPKYVSVFLQRALEDMTQEEVQSFLGMTLTEINYLLDSHFLNLDVLREHQFSPAWVPAEREFSI